MLKILVKARLQGMFSTMFRGSKKKKEKKKKNSLIMKILIALLAVYVIGVLGFLFGFYFDMMAVPFHTFGIDWLYFTFMAIFAFALMFISSVFMTYSQLYEAKDNELLLAMPIPPGAILGSRMISLYVINLAFELLVVVPAMVVYGMNIGLEVISVVMTILISLLLPLFSLALSSILGGLLAIIGSKIRNKNIFTMIFSCAFLFAYFYFYTGIMEYMQMLVNNGTIIAAKIKAVALPVYWIGNGIAEGNLLETLYVIAIFAVVFGIVYAVLSATFIKAATTKKGVAKRVYRKKNLVVSNLKAALLKKELRHFVSSPTYMLNAGLGVLFNVVAIIAMIIKRDDLVVLISGIPGVNKMVGVIVAAMLTMLATLNIITAPSISIEGKTLWISKSFPIKAKDFLLAKLNLHVVITMPPIVLGAIAAICCFDVTITDCVIMLVLPVAANYVCALLGLIINLYMPKFNWDTEAIAIKQSGSTVVAMFGSFALWLVPLLLYALWLYKVINIVNFVVVITVIMVLLAVALYALLMTAGSKVYGRLQS